MIFRHLTAMKKMILPEICPLALTCLQAGFESKRGDADAWTSQSRPGGQKHAGSETRKNPKFELGRAWPERLARAPKHWQTYGLSGRPGITSKLASLYAMHRKIIKSVIIATWLALFDLSLINNPTLNCFQWYVFLIRRGVRHCRAWIRI
jgi:hypothetical protein